MSDYTWYGVPYDMLDIEDDPANCAGGRTRCRHCLAVFGVCGCGAAHGPIQFGTCETCKAAGRS